jgi:hypothetical protein
VIDEALPGNIYLPAPMTAILRLSAMMFGYFGTLVVVQILHLYSSGDRRGRYEARGVRPHQ